MSGNEIKSGDWVEFVDADQNRWGPWKVLKVSRKTVRISIENMLTDDVPRHRLRKVRRVSQP